MLPRWRTLLLSCLLSSLALSQGQLCVRSSYNQQSKDLTRYTRCIPASVDVGTCRGSCTQIPFLPRVCRLCDVTEYATQTIRCRNMVGNLVSVKVDVVKKCGCTSNPAISVGTPFPTSRPTRRPTNRPIGTRRPTARPVTRRPTFTTCPPEPRIGRVCLRYVGAARVPEGFSCRRDSDAQVDARLNAACAAAFPGSRAISGLQIRAEKANPGSIECLPQLAPWPLAPTCPYCGGGCDCSPGRVCATGTGNSTRAWSDIESWPSNHGGSVLQAGCVKPCVGNNLGC